MARRLLAASVLLPPVAMSTLALAFHPSDGGAFLVELLWGAGLVAVCLTVVTGLIWLGSVIADRVRPRSTPRVDVSPVSNLGLHVLAADTVVTIGLALTWLVAGHLELAFWCGTVLGLDAFGTILGLLGVVKPLQPGDEGSDDSSGG